MTPHTYLDGSARSLREATADNGNAVRSCGAISRRVVSVFGPARLPFPVPTP